MKVAKEGPLLIDHKYDAGGFGALHDRIETMSAGKTITAALVGAAVQQGLFSIDVPLIKYGMSGKLVNWSKSGVDFFPNVTARHLLTQTTGAGLVPPGSALTYDSDTYTLFFFLFCSFFLFNFFSFLFFAHNLFAGEQICHCFQRRHRH